MLTTIIHPLKKKKNCINRSEPLDSRATPKDSLGAVWLRGACSPQLRAAWGAVLWGHLGNLFGYQIGGINHAQMGGLVLFYPQ